MIASLRIALLALPLAVPAAAQAPSDYDRALAAGYKAQFLCSGLWNGGKTVQHVERDELTGVYDRIAAILPTLPAEIDEEAGQVRVAWDVAMPPRTAQWRDGLGCAGLPIGATRIELRGEDLQRGVNFSFKGLRDWAI